MGDKRETVIVSAVRTPFGRLGGSLKDFPAADLGAICIREALKRAGIEGKDVEYVLMGMVVQAGAGQVPSRQAAIKAGIPYEVPSDTINKVCISSMRTVSMGDQMIRAGDVEIVVAGGMESMSNGPFALREMRWGHRMGNSTAIDLMVCDGLTCPIEGVHMGVLGNREAKGLGITREEQDAWALRSHQRAIAAIDAGKLKEEIVPVEIPQKKGVPLLFDTDEAPRRDTSLEKLAALPPAFEKDGMITAGNAPGINDGAGALVLMSRAKAEALGLKPLATILGTAAVSAPPDQIAHAPAFATQKVLKKLGMGIDQMSLIESNEAFAAVTLGTGKIVGWDFERVNVNGGAVAFGHPIGASGARIIMTLIYELRRRGGGLGLATMCGGLAQGDAVVLAV